MKHNRFKIDPLTAAVLACGVGISGAVCGFVLSSTPTEAAMSSTATSPTTARSAIPSTEESSSNHSSDGVKSSTAVKLDRSGRKQVGLASFYANRYAGKTMADGTPMKLYSNNAASVTLPLGTTARVVNVQNGRSALVTIRDRGPYVRGRIIDLSPATAQLIGIKSTQGLGRVEVIPISMPLPDGTVWQAHTVIARN